MAHRVAVPQQKSAECKAAIRAILPSSQNYDNPKAGNGGADALVRARPPVAPFRSLAGTLGLTGQTRASPARRRIEWIHVLRHDHFGGEHQRGVVWRGTRPGER